jgi:hypothetical protein
MSLFEKLAKGDINMFSLDKIIFSIFITLVSWAMFRYNWALMLPLGFGFFYVHGKMFTTFRVYRYITSALSSYIWGVIGLFIGWFFYTLMKQIHPGYYFVVMISLFCYGMSLYWHYKQFKLDAADDEEINQDTIKKNNLAKVTLIICSIIYVITIIVFLNVFDIK